MINNGSSLGDDTDPPDGDGAGDLNPLAVVVGPGAPRVEALIDSFDFHEIVVWPNGGVSDWPTQLDSVAVAPVTVLMGGEAYSVQERQTDQD